MLYLISAQRFRRQQKQWKDKTLAAPVCQDSTKDTIFLDCRSTYSFEWFFNDKCKEQCSSLWDVPSPTAPGVVMPDRPPMVTCKARNCAMFKDSGFFANCGIKCTTSEYSPDEIFKEYSTACLSGSMGLSVLKPAESESPTTRSGTVGIQYTTAAPATTELPYISTTPVTSTTTTPSTTPLLTTEAYAASPILPVLLLGQGAPKHANAIPHQIGKLMMDTNSSLAKGNLKLRTSDVPQQNSAPRTTQTADYITVPGYAASLVTGGPKFMSLAASGEGSFIEDHLLFSVIGAGSKTAELVTIFTESSGFAEHNSDVFMLDADGSGSGSGYE